MQKTVGLCIWLSVLFALGDTVGSAQSVWKLVGPPTLSPNGKTLVFSHAGDLWKVPSKGGRAVPLTLHPADDSQPHYSRDGKHLAFVSNREGQDAIYRIPARGGTPKRITFHSEGYSLQGWFPNHHDVLAVGSRDHFWRRPNRLIRVNSDERSKEQILTNAYADDASVSADGKRILFVREGERWWRKGYYGSRSAQIWLLDLESGESRLVLSETYDCRWPRWIGNENAFVFTRGASNGFELCRFDFTGEQDELASDLDRVDRLKPMAGTIKALTEFGNDSVVFPTVSADGSTVAFRHLFDLYTLSLKGIAKPKKVKIVAPIDSTREDEVRRTINRATEVAFTRDGLEMALIAGGDLWVMDTKLREPRRVTSDPGWTRSPIFSKDGRTLYAIRDVKGKVDIYRITRKDETRYWWQNEAFHFTAVTKDAAVESDLRLSPDQERLFFVRGLGELVHTDTSGKDRKTITRGFAAPDYDISPDGRWIAYAQSDNQFNSEIFLVDVEGKQTPYNLSRHPDNDEHPKFSPDGKILAFTGRRVDQEIDIYYAWLRESDRDKSNRQRELEEAIKLLEEKRKKSKPKSDAKTDNDSEKEESEDEQDAAAEVTIDFASLHERLKRISIPGTSERSLVWHHEGKRLAFVASIDGQTATYSVTFPDELKPEKYSETTGTPVAWPKDAGGLLMLSDGVPTLVKDGKAERYRFSADQSFSRSAWLQAGFDTAWRTMRDRWYDPSTGRAKLVCGAPQVSSGRRHAS